MSKFPKIPGYRIVSKIGQGSTASIYLGIHRESRRKVAIKVLLQKWVDDKEYVHRFLREARLVSRLKHPNIVAIYDVGKDGNLKYIVMECLERSLKNILDIDPVMPIREALALVKKIAETLHYAHSMGIIHRDIKPGNILFRKNGTPVIVDFGLARAVESNTRITKSGVIMGTASYMSPEQCRGEKADHQSDIYNLGIMLYEMLTGEVPYKADTQQGVWIKHITEPIPVLPFYLRNYQPLVEGMLAKERKDRISSGSQAAEMIESLGFDKADEYTDITNTEIMTGIKKKNRSNRFVFALSVAAIILFLAMIIVFIIYLNSSTGGKAAASTIKKSSQNIIIDRSASNIFKSENRGGSITFSLPDGTYEKRVEISLSYENLKSPSGDDIPSEVYYTLDGSGPTRENAIKYNPFEKITFDRAGEYIAKAKLFSKVGKYEGPVYSQKYIINPNPQKTPEKIKPATETLKPKIEPPQPGAEKAEKSTFETITNFMQLDEDTRGNFYNCTKKIPFEVKGFKSVKKVSGRIAMEIFISHNGLAKMLHIFGLEVTPKDKEDDFKAALAAAIQKIKFLPPTRNGKPVNVKIWIDYKKIASMRDVIILHR